MSLFDNADEVKQIVLEYVSQGDFLDEVLAVARYQDGYSRMR
jgi:hypothetical protein